MIEVKNLSKSFDKLKVLKDINVVFEKGKTNLIIGQSGSGKTVLLKSIVGLHEADEGQIIFDQSDVCKASGALLRRLRRQVGMVFGSIRAKATKKSAKLPCQAQIMV